MKQLVAFDLDGTLAPSKEPIDPAMGIVLARLTNVMPVAVMSGGDWPQFEAQLVSLLPGGADLERLFLLPASGTKFYRYADGWNLVYAETFSASERENILAALDQAIASVGLNDKHLWGDRIEDRGSQITFSGLGQFAPLDAKLAWDPDFARRKRLQSALQPLVPGFAVRVGGSTSVDITREGIDKAYGIGKLTAQTGIPAADMIFIGDALYEGGNDYPVRAIGVDTLAVRDVSETMRIIETILLCRQR